MEELLFQLLLGGAHLLEAGRGAVRDVEAAGTGAVGVEDSQCLTGRVEGKAAEGHLLIHLLIEGDKALQTAQEALHLKQLHMVGSLPCGAAAEGVADILHLAQEDHRLVHSGFQLRGVAVEALHIVQLLLQCLALFGSVELQSADALDTEGRAAVQRLENILQADLDLIIKRNGNHSISSLTLITGASMASFILAIKASLSKCQP